MNKKKYISRIFIAAFFLASYSGVYATYFLCNLVPLISASDNLDLKGHGNDHHENTSSRQQDADGAQHGDAIHHGDEHHTNSNSHDRDSHSHEHGEAMDECCNDLTSSFLDSLPKLSLKQLHLEFAIDYGCIVQAFLVLDKPVLKTYSKLVRYIYPPPKVPDIRIFIQSFII